VSKLKSTIILNSYFLDYGIGLNATESRPLSYKYDQYYNNRILNYTICFAYFLPANIIDYDGFTFIQSLIKSLYSGIGIS